MRKLLSKSNLEQILKYGIAAILIAIPLYPKFPFLKVPGIYVSIRIEDFLILAVSIVWLIYILPNIRHYLENKIIRAVILFLVTGFIATLIGYVFLKTVVPLVGFLEWARRVEYLSVFLIGLTVVKSKKDLEFFLKCIGIVVVFVFLFGLAQKYFNFPVITTQNQEYSKGIALRYVPGTQLVSTFAGHYDLASYMLIISPIIVAMIFVVKKYWQKVIILIVTALCFWLMINAASRITALAYVGSISLTLIILRKQKYIPLVIIATGAFTLLTSNLFDRYLNIFNVLKDKLSDIIAPPVHAQDVLAASTGVQDLSTSIRLNIEWPRAIRAFLKNPLLGTGYSSTTLATDNDYLRALAETGILGFISLYFVFYRIGKELVLNSWTKGILSKKEIDFRTAFLAGVIGMLPGVLLNALFIDIFEASKFAIPFWMIMGFAVALVVNKEK